MVHFVIQAVEQVDMSHFTVNQRGTGGASKNRNMRHDRAGELIEQLKGEVQELPGKAEQADRADVDKAGSLPPELARHQALQAKLEAARRRSESSRSGWGSRGFSCAAPPR